MRLIHYLFSLAAHIISGSLGRRTPSSIPFARGKAIPIKRLPSWQIFIALWIFQKIWGKYGDAVTSKAREHAGKYQGPGAATVQNFTRSTKTNEPKTITVEPVSQQSEA